MTGVVIIGAGLAGFQCCESLRMEGYEGPVTMIGDEPVAPYQRPPLSKAYLLGEMDAERLQYRPDAFYQQNKITMRLGVSVDAVDRGEKRVSLSNGEGLDYDKLILATGARVRKLPVAGAGLEGVCYLRTLADVDAIRDRMDKATRIVVVGAGFIGLEFAAVACKLGKKVQVLEAAERVLARIMPPPLSQFFEQLHGDNGVDIMCGAAVEELIGDGDKVGGVKLKGGRVLAADLVMVGIGVEPNVELAQQAGIACDNGIIVDEHGRTSDKDVYAAGDCATYAHPFIGRLMRLESVQNAGDQARSVSAAIAGNSKPYQAIPWFWSDQYAAKLQMAGFALDCDEHIVRGDVASGRFSILHYQGDSFRAVSAVNKAAEYIGGRKLLELKRQPTKAQAEDPDFVLKSLLKPVT